VFQTAFLNLQNSVCILSVHNFSYQSLIWPLPFFPGYIYWPCRAGSLYFFVFFINGLIGFLVLSKRRFKIVFYFRPPFLGYTWSCCSVVLLFRGLVACHNKLCSFPFKVSLAFCLCCVATDIGVLYFSIASGNTKCHLRTLLYASVLRLLSPRCLLH
jgi:hypothetical protein